VLIMKLRQKSSRHCSKFCAFWARDASQRLSWQLTYGWYSLWSLQREIFDPCSRN